MVGRGFLDTASRNSRAGCKERMYTSSTAGGDRTAGRDGRGAGPPRLTRTPFNPAGGERGGGDGSLMLMQALECSATLSQKVAMG